MSKMSEMAMTIEELRNAAAAITDAANYLAQLFSGNDAEEQPEEKAPVQKPALTLEQSVQFSPRNPVPVTQQASVSCSRNTVPASSLRWTRPIIKRCFVMRR